MEQTTGIQTLLRDKKNYNIMIKNHTDIINALIKKHGYKSYLEIGVHRRFMNFDHIEIDHKVGVDPIPEAEVIQMTSDDFFYQNHKKFDIIFIDGLHHAFQVFKDISNAFNILNDGGTIIVHDCSPTSEEMQIVPGDERGVWTGDGWKAWVWLRGIGKEISMEVVDIDWGCGIIQHGTQECLPYINNITYQELEKNRKEWLNLINVEEFEQKYIN